MRLQPVASATRPATAPDPASATPAALATPTASASEPVKPSVELSVGRDQSGVFVYTLTDSSSGRVIAVIPRSAVAAQSGAGRGSVDIQA